MSVNTVNSDGSLLRVAGGTLYADLPVGSIIPYGGGTVQSGFLLCDGAEVLKTAYAELYAVIGNAFGTASDNTKFVLPDLRESVPKGAGLTGKTVGAHLDADGLAVGEFLDDRLQNYFAGGDLPTYIGGESLVANLADGDHGFYVGAQRRELTATRRGATTEVKAVGVNYIIKAKQSAIPADFMDAVEDAVAEFAPVDTVENGNMKAVTSNAVYDILNASITDLTVDETEMTYDDYTVETLGAHMYQVGMLCWVHIDLRATYTGEVALDTDGHKDFWSNKFSIPDFDDVSEWSAVPCFGYISNSHRTFEITLNNFGATGGQKAIAFRLRYSEDEPIYTGDVFTLRSVCCFAKA